MLRNLKRGILLTAGVLFLCLFVLSGTLAVYKVLNESRSEKRAQQLAKMFVTPETDEAKQKKEQEGAAPLQVDLNRLKEQNPDTAAWLYVPSLSLSYPVMFSGDNEYYLHRGFFREPAFAGSVFIDEACRPDFSSANTILYGHNMLSGEMFGTLWKVPYQKISLEDPSVWIVTPDRILKYRIFSSFVSDLYSEGFELPERGTQDFLNWTVRMCRASFLPPDAERFREKDRVVTLVTCGENKRERIFVMGRLEGSFSSGQKNKTSLSAAVPVMEKNGTEAKDNAAKPDPLLLFTGAGFLFIAVMIFILTANNYRYKLRKGEGGAEAGKNSSRERNV